MQVWLDIVWHHLFIIQLWHKYWSEVFQIPYLHKAPPLVATHTITLIVQGFQRRYLKLHRKQHQPL